MSAINRFTSLVGAVLTIAAGFISLLGVRVEWMGLLGLGLFTVGFVWLPVHTVGGALPLLGLCFVALGGFIGLARLGVVGLLAPGVAGPNVPQASLDQYLIVMVAFAAVGLILIGLDVARDASRALPARIAPLVAGIALPVVLLELLWSGVGFVLAGISWLPSALQIVAHPAAVTTEQ